MARLFGQIARIALIAVGAVVVLGSLGINVRRWWPASA